MKQLTYTRDVLASRLLAELREAGVVDAWTEDGAERRLGVSVIDPVEITADAEHIPTGDPSSVVITVPDDTDEKLVEQIVAAHDPTPATPVVPFEEVLAEAVRDIDPATIVSTDPVSQAIKAVLIARQGEA